MSLEKLTIRATLGDGSVWSLELPIRWGTEVAETTRFADGIADGLSNAGFPTTVTQTTSHTVVRSKGDQR